MQEMKCQTCGAELVEGTNFCRQCGAPINGGASEQTTELLDETDAAATRRLASRETAPGRGQVPAAESNQASPSRKGIWIGAAVIAVVGIVCALTLIGLRSKRAAAADLIYPGSKTIMEMNVADGSRALQLETSDSLKSVEDWYTKNLKPEKVIRLTAGTVIIKNEKVTATIAADGPKTNISVKSLPQ